MEICEKKEKVSSDNFPLDWSASHCVGEFGVRQVDTR